MSETSRGEQLFDAVPHPVMFCILKIYCHNRRQAGIACRSRFQYTSWPGIRSDTLANEIREASHPALGANRRAGFAT